jgi:hypothetical protein
MAASAVEPKLTGVHIGVFVTISASPRRFRKYLLGVAILAQQPGMFVFQSVMLIVVKVGHPIPAIVAL